MSAPPSSRHFSDSRRDPAPLPVVEPLTPADRELLLEQRRHYLGLARSIEKRLGMPRAD